MSAMNIANVVNPLPLYDGIHREAETPELHTEANYINNRVDSILDTAQKIPQADRNVLPEGIRNITTSDVAKAESDTLDYLKKSEPAQYETTIREHEVAVYEAEARASLLIEEAMDEPTANQLYDQIKIKTGEFMATKPDLSQKEAAALAIANLSEQDSNFKKINPTIYGAFQTWALANIEINRVVEENIEANRKAAMFRLRRVN